MSTSFTLYTVRGEREVVFAAVETKTGRVWTAPNRDGALRQARDAGLTDFREQSVSREEFLRSLGFEKSMRLDQGSVKHPPAAKTEAFSAEPSRKSSAQAWFAPGEGSLEEKPADVRFPPVPPPLKKGGGGRSKKGKSPFAAQTEIAAPVTSNTEDQDVLIVPKPPAIPSQSPFSDRPS